MPLAERDGRADQLPQSKVGAVAPVWEPGVAIDQKKVQSSTFFS